jgi:chemotaxis protein MotB
MAAEKKGQTIIIKKIYNVAGGHGGAWKVALADFMTAMMAFFLVMWLLSQSNETKKAVSDYFSTPSIIEYNFQNFGVEITLEKLFLDLINEPLKAFQSFLEPIDRSPNLMDMGSEKVVAAFMADKMQDVAKNVNISPEGFEFDIMDYELFIPGTASPNQNFVTNMDRIKHITVGLADSEIKIESRLFNQSVSGSSPELAKQVASERVDILKNKIAAALEHPTVEVSGRALVENKGNFVEGQSQRPPGMINIRIRMKEVKSDGSKPRKLETLFGKSDSKMNVYDNFVKQLAEQKKNGRGAKNENRQKPEESESANSQENSAPNKIKN